MLELFLCLKPQNREYQVRLAIRKKETCSGLQGALLSNLTPTILDPTESFCPSSCVPKSSNLATFLSNAVCLSPNLPCQARRRVGHGHTY